MYFGFRKIRKEAMPPVDCAALHYFKMSVIENLSMRASQDQPFIAGKLHCYTSVCVGAAALINRHEVVCRDVAGLYRSGSGVADPERSSYDSCGEYPRSRDYNWKVLKVQNAGSCVCHWLQRFYVERSVLCPKGVGGNVKMSSDNVF